MKKRGIFTLLVGVMFLWMLSLDLAFALVSAASDYAVAAGLAIIGLGFIVTPRIITRLYHMLTHQSTTHCKCEQETNTNAKTSCSGFTGGSDTP